MSAENPPFVDKLRTELVDGYLRLEQVRRRRIRIVGAAGVIGVLALAFLVTSRPRDEAVQAGDLERASSTMAPTAQAGPSSASDCRPPASIWSLEAGFERFVAAYNDYDVPGVVAVVGDGTVDDPSLDLSRSGSYPSVEEWVAAARTAGDRLEVQGYGPGSPFQLFATRSNNGLAAAGIDRLSLTLAISLSTGCEQRVRTSDEISAPDACTYQRLVEPANRATGCRDPFEPRASHVSIWTGDELLIFGGAAGTTDDPPLTTGLGFSPTSGWRDLEPAPVAVSHWPAMFVSWADDRMIVVGSSQDGVVVLSYDPDQDSWTVSPPLPEERYGPGAAVSTGLEVIIVGGSQNDPRDTAWAYDLETIRWRQLPDPGIRPVENMAGTWTGTEAIFYGGYGLTAAQPGVAYQPDTDSWRPLPPTPVAQLEGHELVWTGTDAIAVGGHSGPSHSARLPIYNPATDTWRASAQLPIPAVEDLGVAWTGTELLLWGGFGTYNNGVSAEGARYDPVQDTWTAMATSPLTARCSHSATMTPIGFIVFGGLEICGDPGILARGNAAIYDPTNDNWAELSP